VSRRFIPPPAEVVEEIRRLAERRLSAEEFDAYVRAPMSDEERREINELIDWFVRRYPTPAARLAQARASYRAAELFMPRTAKSG
jgi:hypothetical protein